MSFLGGLLNSLPVVGHVKAVVHYACGDKDGGNRALWQATRTTAVVGAAVVGASAGPVGSIGAKIFTGAFFDTTMAIFTHDNQEFVEIDSTGKFIGKKQVSGVAKIFENPDKLSSYVGAAIEMVGDGLTGVGGSINFGDGLTGGSINFGRLAGKSLAATLQSSKQVLIEEAAGLAAKGWTRELAVHASSVATVATDAVETVATNVVEAVTSLTAQTSNHSSGRQQQQSTNSSNESTSSGNSREPDDRRDGSGDKKKECQGATMQQQEEFIRIVEKIGEIEDILLLRGKITADCLQIINVYLQEFIQAAIPLMNDPTVRLNIRGGKLEIVMENGIRVGISRRQAALLSRAIQHSVSNTTGVDRPCSRSWCRICPNLRQAPTGWTGSCETTGAIYSFYCSDCHRIVYAGQTTQPLRNRMTQHLNFEGSPLRRHIANTPGHISDDTFDLLDMFDIVIMWTTDGIDTELLDDASIKRIIRNWEVFMQWLAEAHKSQGGESKR